MVRPRRFAVLWLCITLGACSGRERTFLSHDGGANDGGSAGEAGEGGSAADAGEGGSAGERDDQDEGGSAGERDDPGEGEPGGAGGTSSEQVELPQTGLLLWLRADRGIQQKDGFVQSWQDQSENHTNATQSSVNARPAYLATGFNGQPTLEFDGQGQFLKFAEGFGDFSKGLSGLIVAKPTKSDCASMLEFSNGSEIDDIAMGVWDNEWGYEVGEDTIKAGKVDHTTFSLYGAIHRATAPSDLRINGSALSTLQIPVPILPSSKLRANNFVGHSLYVVNCGYFQGQISEIILYSRVLTTIELSAVETYLDAHWTLSEQGAPEP